MSRPRRPRLQIEIPLALPNADRPLLWEGIAESIRQAIVSGAVRAGTSLVEADLADRFQVSRGPIRDALRELAREGLVVELPRRGSVVSTITFADLREVYELREALETAAARLVAERATDSEIGSLMSMLSELEGAWTRSAEYVESLELDLAFHRNLVALAGNGRLRATYEQMLTQTQLHAINAASLNPRLRRGMRQSVHRDIVRALLSRDGDRAARSVMEHYAYARERLLAGSQGRAVDPARNTRSAPAGVVSS